MSPTLGGCYPTCSCGSGRAPLLARYERICFDKDRMHLPGRPVAELVAPGHPLLEALIDLLLERYGDSCGRAAVLVDESDPSERVRVLGVDSAIADG